jgi:hypothetical protein
MIGLDINGLNFWVNLVVSFGLLTGMFWGIIKLFHNVLAKSVGERLEQRIAEVKAETKPNGGSSLRDAVDRIERKLNHVDVTLQRHLGLHEGLEQARED